MTCKPMQLRGAQLVSQGALGVSGTQAGEVLGLAS